MKNFALKTLAAGALTVGVMSFALAGAGAEKLNELAQAGKASVHLTDAQGHQVAAPISKVAASGSGMVISVTSSVKNLGSSAFAVGPNHQCTFTNSSNNNSGGYGVMFQGNDGSTSTFTTQCSQGEAMMLLEQMLAKSDNDSTVVGWDGYGGQFVAAETVEDLKAKSKAH